MAYRGEALRHLREERKIPLRHIADQTRINLWYLSGIEEERFDRFPGAFYFKSFTREYARVLGLDPMEVLRDLEPARRRLEHVEGPVHERGDGEHRRDGQVAVRCARARGRARAG